MNNNFNLDQFLIPYNDMLNKTGVSRLNYYKHVIEKLVNLNKPINYFKKANIKSAQDVFDILRKNESIEDFGNGIKLASFKTIDIEIKKGPTNIVIDDRIIYTTKNKFDSEKLLNKSDFLILEGVGSGQSAFRNYIDFLIWIDINPADGLTKVISRDGTKNSQQMQQFLLDQERHFALENTQNASDWQIISVP
mgnify:CR=1 FL=1